MSERYLFVYLQIVSFNLSECAAQYYRLSNSLLLINTTSDDVHKKLIVFTTFRFLWLKMFPCDVLNSDDTL